MFNPTFFLKMDTARALPWPKIY
jgi:hypothetical protein